jgi:hypothetical protein
MEYMSQEEKPLQLFIEETLRNMFPMLGRTAFVRVRIPGNGG